jgi:hypothetical protein
MDSYESTQHFKFNLCDIPLKINSACEVFDNAIYFIKREISTDTKTGQKWVNYNGFIGAHGLRPDESDYYPRVTRDLEFDQAFPLHGQVMFAELSLRGDPDTGFPTIIDRICQEHSENPDEVSWVCFSQIIDYSPFQGMLTYYFDMDPSSLDDLPSPGIILYIGPEPMELPHDMALESLARPLGDVHSREELEDGVILHALRSRYMTP